MPVVSFTLSVTDQVSNERSALILTVKISLRKCFYCLNSSPIDGLGNWCLKCWQGALAPQAKGREVSP